MKQAILLIILIFSLSNSYSQDTDDSDLLLKAGILKKRDGDIKGAILDYSKAIRLNPNDADIYYFRADAKNLIKDFYGSLEDTNKAIKLNPTVSAYYHARGYTKSMLKDYQGAIIDYTKSIELDDDDIAKAENYLFRGISKLNYHLKKEACIDFSKAGELGLEEAYDYIQKYCN